MKKILFLLISVPWIFWSCVSDNALSSDTVINRLTPIHPPTPRVPSILPLEKNNEWVYTAMVYDSSGLKTNPSDELNLSMPRFYTLQDTILKEISGIMRRKNPIWGI